MNRHFVHALAVEPLGTPIRKEPEPAPEPKWEPASTAGYETRTVNGKVELRPKNLPPDVPFPWPVAPVVPVVSEWQEGAPPERGWYEASIEGDVAYWFGDKWSFHVPGVSREHFGYFLEKAKDEEMFTHLSLRWRGPRLTGPDFPEST